jgi:hypothetical protein
VRKCNALKTTMAEFEAEDAVVGYLCKMPATLGKLVALPLAKSRVTLWEAKKTLMLRQGDPRPVYQFGPNNALWLDAELAKITPDDVSTAYEEEQAGSMLVAPVIENDGNF